MKKGIEERVLGLKISPKSHARTRLSSILFLPSSFLLLIARLIEEKRKKQERYHGHGPLSLYFEVDIVPVIKRS